MIRLYVVLFLAVLLWTLHAWGAAAPPESNVALPWNSATLQGIRDAKLGSPVVARALAIVHTCMYDAWAAYGSGNGTVGPYQVEPIATDSQGPAACGIKGQAGWVRNVTNQVQQVDGSPYAVSGLTAADQITATTPNQLGVSGAQTGSFPTTGDGSFPDTYFVCSSACPGSGETGALQNWTVAGIPLLHVDALMYKCASITIDGR